MKGYIADLTHIKDVHTSAAISDVLLRELDEDAIILLLKTSHRPNISLGVDDTLVDDFNKGLSFYRRNGYSVHFRNYGGRSIVHDPGVLNFSFILKSNQSGTERYHLLFEFLSEALAPLELDLSLGIVQGTYAFGTYDISINGKKVGGMFQSKTGDNAQVGCYLNVNGDQMHRSETVKRFYELTGHSLDINPYKMSTIEDQRLKPTTIPNITTLLIAHFRNYVDSVSFVNVDAVEEQQEFKVAKERIINQDKKYLSTKKGD